MGKWYSVPNYVRYKEDIEYTREDIAMYLPHVITIARSFPQNQMAIGTLTLNDLIQAGNIGLLKAWERVDWELINNAENSQGTLWSFLKKRIRFAIRQEIDSYGAFIKIPDRVIKEARKEMKFADKILVNIFPKFFDKLVWGEDITPLWQSIQLEELIDDELNRVVQKVEHRQILLQFYGIGYPKLSQKELATKYAISVSNVQNIVSKTREKLNNKQFSQIIKNFYLD